MPNAKKIIDYAKNVGKEAKQAASYWNKATEMGGRVGPGTDAAANRLRRRADAEFGQFLGATLQGRRYDEKGKQIVATKPKPVKKATAPAMPKKTGPAVAMTKKSVAKKAVAKKK